LLKSLLQSLPPKEDDSIVALCYMSLNEEQVHTIISFLRAVMRCQAFCGTHQPLDPNALTEWFKKVGENLSKELKKEKRRQVKVKSRLQKQEDLSEFPWVIFPKFWQVSLKNNSLLQPVSIKAKNLSSWLPIEVRVAEEVIKTKLSFDNPKGPEIIVEQIVVPQMFSQLSQIGVTTRASPIIVTCTDHKGKMYQTQITLKLVSSEESLPVVIPDSSDVTRPCLNKILIAAPLGKSKEQ
jgi:hypothetical protein